MFTPLLSIVFRSSSRLAMDPLFAETSLRILRPSTLDVLSLHLSPRKQLYTETGLLRDYRGLGELAGLSAADLQRVENAPDKLRQLVTLWIRDPQVSERRGKKEKDGQVIRVAFPSSNLSTKAPKTDKRSRQARRLSKSIYGSGSRDSFSQPTLRF